MQIKTQGMVLKQRNIGENDRIITILSKELGLIEATARNVKATRSSIGGFVQILSYNDFCLFKGKSGYIVNSAETINTFYDLRLDVIKLSLAGYFCELTAYLCSAGDDNSESYLRLLLNTLHYLQTEKREAPLLKCIFELRSMSIAGFMPNLVCCNVCATYEDENMLFMPVDGTLICVDCYSQCESDFVKTIKYAVNSSVLSAMRFIIFSEIKKLFLFRVTGNSLQQLGFITENYTLLHTEARFNSLEMYNSLIAMM